MAAEMQQQIFESAMMICFGASWPVAIAKTLRVRKVHGKSIIFLFLVEIGYLSGIVAKFIKADWGLPEAVTLLYALNALMVLIEITLYFRFRTAPDQPALGIQPESPAAQVRREPRE